MLTTFYPPYSFGGDAMGVQRLARALVGRGHHVTMVHDIDAYITLARHEPDITPVTDGIEVIGLRSNFGMISNLLTHQLGRPVVHHRQLTDILSPGAFDIIWYNNISLVGGPGILSCGDGIKIYEAHEHWLVCPTHVLWRHNRETCDSKECLRCCISYKRPPQLWRNTQYFQKQLDQVDVFVAKSEFSREKHREFGFTKEMKVIPYFLPDTPHEKTPSDEPPHDRPYFLFVGRLEKIKGVQDVIPNFANYPNADFLIIGSGEYEAELKKMAAPYPNIKFLGRLSPEELSRYYKSAIALIVPSVCYETFGIILIEAFREGTPVLVRKIGPFTEIVNRCEGGVLYSNNDEMVQAMHQMQEQPEYRSKLARSARSGFENHWSEDKVVNEYFTTLRYQAIQKGYHDIAKALEA